MNRIRVYNRTRKVVIAEDAKHARGLKDRMVGLLGSAEWGDSDGLVLDPCNSVHMFGMGYAIDVLFTGRDGRVMRAVQSLRPWRMSPVVWGARFAIELPLGRVASTGTCVGDEVALEPLETE